MPLNQISNVLPDPILTRLAVELGTGGPFIADMVAPVAQVQLDSFKYATWGQEEIKLDYKARRSPGQPANRIQLSKSYTAGNVLYRSLASDIPDEIRQNDPNGDQLDGRRVRVLTNKLRLEVETAVAALCQAATALSALTGTDQWDNAAPVNIRKNLLASKETFRAACGFYPNVLIVPPKAKKYMFAHSDFLSLIQYQAGPEFLKTGQIPVIDNMEVIIPGAIIDASNPGASQSIADVWSTALAGTGNALKEIYFLYVDRTAGNDLEAQTAMRQVRSTATGGNAFNAYRWRNPDLSAKTEHVAVEVNQVELTVASGMLRRQVVLNA
jgi:hypothetical protein